MLTTHQLQLIKDYVNPKYFDQDKLIYYLSNNEYIKHEVFAFVDNRFNEFDKNSRPYYCDRLDLHLLRNGKEYGMYRILHRDQFIKRIPFYFYYAEFESNDKINLIKGKKKNKITGQYMFGTLRDIVPYDHELSMDDVLLEDWWQTLEMMFYEFKIPLEYIFNYKKREDFNEWFDYIKLCKEFNYQNYLPQNFTYHYNILLLKAGREPIIYTPDADPYSHADNFYKDAHKIVFSGNFPRDNEGNPIMEWIGIEVHNAKKIYCKTTGEYENVPSIHPYRERFWELSYLIIELTPETEIAQLYPDKEWYYEYRGPALLSIKGEAIKYYRQLNKLTQKEIADSINTSIRTYQKWEAGQAVPDGNALIKLMQVLNVDKPQSLCF